MWHPARQTRLAIGLALAAALALLGSAMLLAAGRALPVMGGSPSGQPGLLLLAVVILLAATGVLLLVMAAKELADSRHPRRVR